MPAVVSLPVLQPGRPWRLTPTDVSQFVRMEQCERFLPFRLAERAGQDFMAEYDVAPQRITPLLSLSGREFEEEVEKRVGGTYRTVNYAALAGGSHNRPHNNAHVVASAQNLTPGEVVLRFQARLEVELHGWLLRGDVDLIRLERNADATLDVLIADMKSTTEVKVEHRLQITFYRLMLERLFADHGVPHHPVRTAVLFRPLADPTDEELVENEPLAEAALHLFGLDDTLLDEVADPDAYTQSALDLVLGADSTARRVAGTPFDDLPYCLSFKCDGCLYNEFCLKWSAEREDLSLLPYMTATDKEALRRLGVTTVRSLATLKDFGPSGTGDTPTELVPAIGREAQVKQIAATWPVGPRLDELIHRAKSFRRSIRKDGTAALSFIPGRGNSTLPASTPALNPNLVRIFVDAQHDYLEDRVYLLGALVVACRDGAPAARRAVVRMTAGPPDTAAKERQLFVDWTRDLVRAVVDIAVPTEPGEEKTAPVHVVFFDRHEQRVMLEALARNFPPVIQATPPLYDFLTQLAAFDSPIATYLADEVRAFKNFPMTCQSLQAIATYLKFDWNAPHKFREAFKARHFDYLGKLDIDGQSEWFTKRSRLASSIPLEYAYAAWGRLPPPRPGTGDEFADFRGLTGDVLTAFEGRRLEAMEHVTGSLRPNPNTQKTPFVLPDLATYEDKAHDLAHALHEFVTIERLVELNDWKATRHAPPEQRVLMGETLLVRYVEAGQDPAVAEQNRENQRRQRKREELTAAFRAANPGKPFRLNKEQSAQCRWSPEGLRVRLRIETAGADCDLHDALALSTLRDGDRLVLYPRWAVDERLPPDQRTEFTPTPKQMLYGPRAELIRVVATVRNREGRVTEAFAEVELKESFGGEWSRGFVFPAINRPLEDGKLYTLDPCPNDWYGYWCGQVVDGLCEGQPNILYDRLVKAPLPVDAGGRVGQVTFLAGLDAFHAAGHLHDFESGKRVFIGGHGRTPVLMVQGPPGTGKSYSTAFAVFARLQAAMKENRPLRAFVSCKTHAATDVLLQNVLEVREKLRDLRAKSPGLFAQYFDERLLSVPLFRVAPKEPPPDGVTPLEKDADQEKGEEYNADRITELAWCVVGITPGGVYGMVKAKWPKELFGHGLCDLLVLDEASQMNLPEAVMAALPLKPDGQLIVVGDHRQMPPIVKHDWEAESRRTFRQYQVYASLFDTLQQKDPPVIRFAESFRLHSAMAEYLRWEVYRHDGINYHSRRRDVLPAVEVADELVAAALHPDYPLVVVVHGEAGSQVRNTYEQALIDPILRTLSDPAKYGLGPEEGLGVVVPHRAQRAAMRQSFPELNVFDAATGLPARSAIDTVERFQGGERTVVLVSATESERAYLLASSGFLLDPRRLTVAVSRAKRKMILVASRSIFSLFSPDEETFANALLWKNLLRTCCTRLWSGERGGLPVVVWGRPGDG
jgi:hypothetical protein